MKPAENAIHTSEASIEIAAPPEAVYAMVSDITRMGEWRRSKADSTTGRTTMIRYHHGKPASSSVADEISRGAVTRRLGADTSVDLTDGKLPLCS